MNTDLYKKILLDQKYITEGDALQAEKYEKAGRGNFVDFLIQQEILNSGTLGLAIAEHYNTKFIDIASAAPSLEDLSKLPEQEAKKWRAIFVRETKSGVVVATDEPTKAGLADFLKAAFPKKKVEIYFAFPEDIANTLSHHQKELNTRFSEIIQKEKRVAPEIFEEIVKDAISYRASDIHFEPQSGKTIVRFRIDGMLRLAGVIPKEYYENVLNRIKIQANLRTDEHFMPQDGAVRFQTGETVIDLRVSIVPALDGEKVVIRVLAEYVKNLSFSDLGFSEKNIALLEAASKKPFGMIVVSGPTGSGKTTTLYSLIKKLNTPETNITTIEDPVEYRMLGANQIQVNQKTGLTFAKGLRAIVRQDPNVILVGEIRDTETAETAINAALTGHLLLSTFHANDASTTIPRLLEMGVEPFLLSSTLELIIAQRLARRICASCKESYVEKTSELPSAVRAYFKESEVTLYRGKGCSVCNQTGYNGRVSIVEIVEVNGKIKELINTSPSSGEIASVAQKTGTVFMFEDGIEKARSGITSIEEVLRVASPVNTAQEL